VEVAELKTSTTAKNQIQEKRQSFFNKEGLGSFFSESNQPPKAFFKVPPIQAKLTIGQPNDKYEVEADTMADTVVQRLFMDNEPVHQNIGYQGNVAIQTKCNDCAEEETLQKKEDADTLQNDTDVQLKPIFESNNEPTEVDVQTKPISPRVIQAKCSTCAVTEASVNTVDREEKFQKKEEEELSETEAGVQTKSMDAPEEPNPGLEGRLGSSKGGGSSLSPETQGSMGSAFGADFSNVKIHTGSEAVQMNQELGAQAFTHGNDIYFNEGKYDTNSNSGKHLLAHELTHTVQQGGSVSKKIQRSNPPVTLESPVRPNAQACLVHLHGDEANALSVAQNLHRSSCVNLTFIDNPGRRMIRIDVPGHTGISCNADPNRIFSDAGINTKWDDWNRRNTRCRTSPVKTAAIGAVKQYRDNDLNPKIRQCRGQSVDANQAIAGTGVTGSLPVMAFHNNRDQATARNSRRDLTINSYRPGRGEASATETDPSRLNTAFTQINQNAGSGVPTTPSNPHIQTGRDVDDFILVTSIPDFVNAYRAGRNVVLQIENPPQDGSLSVSLSGGRYVNIEAQKSRSTNTIQEAMGQEALSGMGVGSCPAANIPSGPGTNSQNTEPSPAPIRRKLKSPTSSLPFIQMDVEEGHSPSINTVDPSLVAQNDQENSTLSLASIWDFLGRFLRAINGVMKQLETMPTPLPRQNPPTNLPNGCLTYADLSTLTAQKNHWVSVISAMSTNDMIDWIIGRHNPPGAVGIEVDRQKQCMLSAMRSASGVTMPTSPWSQRHRNFQRQSRIWQQKFDFTRNSPFDRISPHARSVCGALLLPTEIQWNTSIPRHRACWGVPALAGTTLPVMPASTRSLTADEKQQEILQASSAPGISRHHWGTDVDVFSTEPVDFERGNQFADEYSWMINNAVQYGFIQSYTPTSSFMGLGYMEERWHWSYWPISQALTEYAQLNVAAIQSELMAQWGTSNQFSFISRYWKDFMFNVNQTPNI